MRDPRHILITGASSGIGAVLALAYAGPHRRLSLFGRDAARLDAIAAQARARGAEAEIFVVEITDAAAMATAIQAADAARPLDLVIANAGISGGGGGDVEMPTEARPILAVNIDGVVNTLEPALAAMRPRRRGQVAVMSSLAGFAGWPGAPSYSASKGFVRMYGEALRGAFRNERIEVTVICPGFIRTPLTAVNRFPMPFLMDADDAALRIVRGLAAGRVRVAFPWPVYIFTIAVALMPVALRLALLRRLPAKSARKH